MSESYCEICNGLVDMIAYVLRISDDKESHEVRGHKNCIDELYVKVKSIKGLDKLSVDKIIKQLNEH